MKTFYQIVAPSFLALMSAVANGAIEYERPWNGVVGGQTSQTSASYPNGVQELADDFSLWRDAEIKHVSWYGAHWGAVPAEETQQKFLIQFYEDSGGIPAPNPFASQEVLPVVEGLGESSLGAKGFYYEATLEEAVFLQAMEVYWIAVMDATLFTDWGWSAGNGGPDNSYASRRLRSQRPLGDWQILGEIYDTSNRAIRLTSVPLGESSYFFLSAVLAASALFAKQGSANLTNKVKFCEG